MNEALVWVISFFLFLLSGTFAGLTLGLLSLDIIGLEIVIDAGSPDDAMFPLEISYSFLFLFFLSSLEVPCLTCLEVCGGHLPSAEKRESSSVHSSSRCVHC
jgi:hypothetical protein